MTTNNAINQPQLTANGQLIIGGSGVNGVAATLTAGSGISITNGAGTITINATGLGETWTTVTGTSQAAAINNGYIANNAGTVTITLPATAPIGSSIIVVGLGAGGWTLAANTGQTIQFGNLVTTSAGSFSSTNQFDTIEVVCMVANTTWSVISSVSAGLTKA